MVGCSGSPKFESTGESILINGKPTLLSEYNGTEGTYGTEVDTYSAKYHKCTLEFRDCPNNRQGVHEADLSEYKKGKYFSAFIDTYMVLNIAGKEDSKEFELSTGDSASHPLSSKLPDAYNTLNMLDFKPITEASFKDEVILIGGDNPITVRSSGISIPGTISVSSSVPDNVNMSQQVEVAGTTVSKGETENYDYYSYGSSYIKAAKGTDISIYVKFKQLKGA